MFFEWLYNLGIILIVGGVTWYIFLSSHKFGSLFSRRSGGRATPMLDTLAVDVTRAAREGTLDPVIGRADEIQRVTQILTRRTKNNVILLGPPGVGKTAIVEGLAEKIIAGDVPTFLQSKRLLSLQVAELLASTKYRGEFEQRIKGLVDEIRRSERQIILFIDEIHTVMQTRGTEGAVSLSDMLKPALARGDLQLIGATTPKEYEEYIQPEESWDRRFQPVLIDEPSVDEAIQILHGLKKNYEQFHQVRFTDAALEAAVRFSKEYIKGRRLPDKAIDVIDEAAAMVNIRDKEHHPAAALLHVAAQTAAQLPAKNGWPEVTPQHIKTVVAEWMGMKVKDIH